MSDTRHYDEGAWEPQFTKVELDPEWVREFVKGVSGPSNRCEINQIGGLVNCNFRVDTDSDSFFLRVVTGNEKHSKKAIVLRDLISQSLPVPGTLAQSSFESFPVVLQPWIEGITLKTALSDAGPDETETLAELVGAVAVKISQTKFKHHGFLDENGKICSEFRFDRPGFMSYMHAACDASKNLLSASLAERIVKYCQRHADHLAPLGEDACLVHGDFHANNLMVRLDHNSWRIAAVVDWESAFSWHTLHDLSHLLRRPFPYRSNLEFGLISGFQKAGGSIPDNWPRIRDLCQLLGWVDKLASGETRTNVIRSAMSAIHLIVGS